jgi:TM2 domain-containing membrane protein YozV
MKAVGIVFFILALLAASGGYYTYSMFEKGRNWPEDQYPGLTYAEVREKGIEEPSYVRDHDKFRTLFFACVGGLALSFFLGLIFFKAGQSRSKKKRMMYFAQNPTLGVVIDYNTIREKLLWILGIVFLLAGVGAMFAGRGMRFFGFFGIGFFLFCIIIIFFMKLGTPKEADQQGIRMGLGRRLQWKDFQNKTSVQVKAADSKAVVAFYDILNFKNGRVKLRDDLIRNSSNVKDYINSMIPARLV